MKETLKKLLAPYGATGREETVSDVIRAMAEPYCDEIFSDPMGNLFCVQHGSGCRVMLAAHMDHIGFVVTDIDEKGFLWVHNVGGVNAAVSLNRHVFFENGVQGLVARKADAVTAKPEIHQLYIDIGAASREEAEALVQRGDVAVYAPDCVDLAAGRMASPAMDNRAGCAVLLETLKRSRGSGKEVYAVFTVQEEVGLRGARAAVNRIDPQVGIALDVTPCGDAPERKGLNVVLGGGAAVKIMDASVICHPGVVRCLERAADQAGCKHQREVLPFGGTDAGAMQNAHCGVPAGVVSIPCRYVHSAVETVDISDLEAAAALLSEYLRGEELY